MDSLLNNGFVKFSSILTNDQLNDIRNCITDTDVNYNCIEKNIELHLTSRINAELKWTSIYTKYRVSNNNNSTDASTFHRDVICYDKNKETYPIYTLLMYLDSTVMQVIQGSHLKPVMSYIEAFEMYGNKVEIKMEPGDVLLFNSLLLHRGIFTENLKSRKLIQVFDVFQNSDMYDQYANRIIHIPADTSSKDRNSFISNMSIYLSKLSVSTSFMNMIGYLNAATGYGYDSNSDLVGSIYYASEAHQPRTIVDANINKLHTINTYIIKQNIRNVSDADIANIRYLLLVRQFIKFTTVFIIFIVLIVSLFSRK